MPTALSCFCPVEAYLNWTGQDNAWEKGRCWPRAAIRMALGVRFFRFVRGAPPQLACCTKECLRNDPAIDGFFKGLGFVRRLNLAFSS